MEKVFQTSVEPGNFYDSEILCETVFGRQVLLDKKWVMSFFFSGESYLGQHPEKYDIILFGRRSEWNVVNCPLYVSYVSSMRIDLLANQGKVTTVPQGDILCVISNPRGDFRNKFLDHLEKHFPITYAGKCRTNYSGPVPKGWWTEEYLKFISGYKVIIAMENYQLETYITEKLVNPVIAGIVPVYWGGIDVCRYFNRDRMILCPDNEFGPVVEEIRRVLNSPEEFLKKVNSPILGPVEMSVGTIAKDIRKHLCWDTDQA